MYGVVRLREMFFVSLCFSFRLSCLVLTLSQVTIENMNENTGEPSLKKTKLDTDDKGKLFLFLLEILFSNVWAQGKMRRKMSTCFL